VPLSQHGLRKHFELPECFDDPDHVELLHELLLGLLKEEVLLVLQQPSLISLADVPEAEASQQLFKDVLEAVLEAGPIQEGEEEAADVRVADLCFVLEVPREGMLSLLHSVQLILM
jgi:hypothetical protein